MLDRLTVLFSNKSQHDHEDADSISMQTAAAALLVEVALMDENFDQSERDVISKLVQNRFNLSKDECDDLIAKAEEAVIESAQLYGFTREVNDRYTPEQRIELMEMLWEVVYADGKAHDFETGLLRRIGGLIYVSDRDRAIARQKVVSRLMP